MTEHPLSATNDATFHALTELETALDKQVTAVLLPLITASPSENFLCYLAPERFEENNPDMLVRSVERILGKAGLTEGTNVSYHNGSVHIEIASATRIRGRTEIGFRHMVKSLTTQSRERSV